MMLVPLLIAVLSAMSQHDTGSLGRHPVSVLLTLFTSLPTAKWLGTQPSHCFVSLLIRKDSERREIYCLCSERLFDTFSKIFVHRVYIRGLSRPTFINPDSTTAK